MESLEDADCKDTVKQAVHQADLRSAGSIQNIDALRLVTKSPSQNFLAPLKISIVMHTASSTIRDTVMTLECYKPSTFRHEVEGQVAVLS